MGLQLILNFVNHPAIHDRYYDFNFLDLVRIDLENVPRENNYIAKFTGRDCTFLVLLKLGISGADRVSAHSFFHRYLLFRNPAVRMLAVESASRGCGVNAEHGIKWRHRPIRPEGQDRARIEQRAKRISGLRAFMTYALFGPASIVNRVIWLHRGDNFIARETWNVLRSQMLSVLDPKAPIAIAVFFFDSLVDRKNVVVRSIADGVNDYL